MYQTSGNWKVTGKYKKSMSETTSGEDRRLGDTDHCFLRISHFTDTEPVTVFQMS